jgi:hypothetical protein
MRHWPARIPDRKAAYSDYPYTQTPKKRIPINELAIHEVEVQFGKKDMAGSIDY